MQKLQRQMIWIDMNILRFDWLWEIIAKTNRNATFVLCAITKSDRLSAGCCFVQIKSWLCPNNVGLYECGEVHAAKRRVARNVICCNVCIGYHIPLVSNEGGDESASTMHRQRNVRSIPKNATGGEYGRSSRLLTWNKHTQKSRKNTSFKKKKKQWCKTTAAETDARLHKYKYYE